MLYHLLYPLHDAGAGVQRVPVHHVQNGGASVTALALSLVLGPVLIRVCVNSRSVR
jgi:hypothetical protein